jgi:hypothetical protein
MYYTEIANATLGQLTDELAAAGWDSTQTEIYEAREAVARLLHEMSGPFYLCESETNEIIRMATVDEVVESANAGPEGHILTNGRRCYVLP